MALTRHKIKNRVLYALLGVVAVLSVVYIIAPFVFRWRPNILRGLIFQSEDEIPDFVDYQHPEKVEFIGGRNFYLKTQDNVTIGVWHTLPVNLEEKAKNVNISNMDEAAASKYYNDWMSGATVFLYLHGSAGTRTSPHRLRVYHMLNKLNYHVVAFDYRGYGDSTGKALNETNVVEDARTVYSWIRDKVGSGNIFLWGHSLGTGVGSHLADFLVSRGEPLSGIVLESPFNNVPNILRINSSLKPFSFLPWFDYCFIRTVHDNDLSFENDQHLKNITTPVIILHAKDDKIIPYSIAVKLYETVSTSRKDSTSVRLISYDANLGYGHYDIAKDSNLNNTIREFVEKYSTT